MGDKKFNYGKAEADLYDSGCHDPEEIYSYRTERGIKDFMRENGLDPDKYYEDKKDGNDSSSESPNSGFGCYLTTACVEAKGLSDDCEELNILRAFRDDYMMNLPEGKSEIAQYYKIAPMIVDRINAKPDAKEIWQNIYTELVVTSVDFIKCGEKEKAYSHYKEYALTLADIYLK